MSSKLKIYRVIVLILFLGNNAFLRVTASDLADRPNIIMIIADHLKPALGCYGDTIAQTPNMDLLARSSFVFGNNHSQQAAVSSPRASMMTGKRPDYIMVWDGNIPIRKMISDILTMPQFFKENGYETAAIGKIFDPGSVDECHDSLSWSVPYRSIMGNFPDRAITRESIRQMDLFVQQNSPFFLVIGFHRPGPPFSVPQQYWDLFSISDMAVPSCQKAATGTPHWVYQSPGGSHNPTGSSNEGSAWNIPSQMELIHGYYAGVSFVDQQIGSIISHLKEKGILENTIIVVCGDQGIHLGDHGIWFENTNLENATRTPLIISSGSRYRGRTDSPTELLDIFPTLCDLTRMHPPVSLDGKSLLPIMTGDRESVKLYSVSQNMRFGDYMGYTFRSERYRYVVWMRNSFRSYLSYSPHLVVTRELYDYLTDPMETVNLIEHAAYREITRRFENWSAHFFIDQEKSQFNGNLFFDD